MVVNVFIWAGGSYITDYTLGDWSGSAFLCGPLRISAFSAFKR